MSTPNCCGQESKWIDHGPRLQYYYCTKCKKEVTTNSLPDSTKDNDGQSWGFYHKMSQGKAIAELKKTYEDDTYKWTRLSPVIESLPDAAVTAPPYLGLSVIYLGFETFAIFPSDAACYISPSCGTLHYFKSKPKMTHTNVCNCGAKTL